MSEENVELVRHLYEVWETSRHTLQELYDCGEQDLGVALEAAGFAD